MDKFWQGFDKQAGLWDKVTGFFGKNKEDDKKEIIFFHASWAGPSNKAKDTLSGMSGFRTVDVDKDMTTPKKYNVRGIPSLIAVENGKEVESLTGNKSKITYEDFLRRNQ